MERSIETKVKGFRTSDGAGVSLVRVLGRETVKGYDPFLMLDSFDSTNPADYTAGFPMHPHRGIETITYLAEGAIAHEDSLGNKGMINAGDVQWMTAGSGIMHEEMPQASDRMLGVQLWLNMAQKDKMKPPAYHSLTKDSMPVVDLEGGSLTVIGGEYKGVQGFQGEHHPIDFYSIRLEDGAKLTLDAPADDQVIFFLLEGDATISGEKVDEKTAVLMSRGEQVTVEANDGPIEVLYLHSTMLEEPVAWGGPIVMNTREELNLAFQELREGTFIKDRPQGEA